MRGKLAVHAEFRVTVSAYPLSFTKWVRVQAVMRERGVGREGEAC